MKFRYWNDEELVDMQEDKNTQKAIEAIRKYDCNEAVVQVYFGGALGRYLPKVFLNTFIDFTEIGYPYEVGSDEEIDAMDVLMEEVDEELQRYLEYFNLNVPGYAMRFGWFDGEICTVIYTIS